MSAVACLSFILLQLGNLQDAISISLTLASIVGYISRGQEGGGRSVARARSVHCNYRKHELHSDKPEAETEQKKHLTTHKQFFGLCLLLLSAQCVAKRITKQKTPHHAQAVLLALLIAALCSIRHYGDQLLY